MDAPMMPWLVAHRGAMAEAPENTRSAFDRALSFPVDGIEFDVHSASDGVPVVFHDDTLKKINGGSRSVADYPYDQLAALDWGRWFSPAHAGERLMTLENVLASYGTRTRLMVEIKPAPKSRHGILYNELARSVARLLRQMVPNDFQDNLYVLSFDPELLKIVREHDPDRRCVLNLNRPRERVSDLGIPVDALHGWGLKLSRLNRNFIALGHGHGQKIMTYSCNTRKTIRRAVDLGVDVVMTDDPGGVYPYLKPLI